MAVVFHYDLWLLFVWVLVVVDDDEVDPQILSIYHLFGKLAAASLDQQNDPGSGLNVVDVFFSLKVAKLLFVGEAYLPDEYFAVGDVAEVGEGVGDGFGDAFDCALGGVDLEGGVREEEEGGEE